MVLDRDERFTSRVWKKFHEELGTLLHFNMTFHPKTDGQSKRTIQNLDDMLQARVLDFGGSWDMYLALAEFCIIKVITSASIDLLLGYYMGGNAEPIYTGVRSVNYYWGVLKWYSRLPS